MNYNLSAQPAHIVWLDVLRFVAIFMMVCSHCADPFNVSPAARLNPDFNFWGSFFGSMQRPCVPLFAAITGLLLLPVKLETGAFYKKRILRVLVPFLIWSVVYNLFPWIILSLGGSAELVNRFFSYAANPSADFSTALQNIVLIPIKFSDYTIHLWYVYMLIGLYLYMPFFSAWVEKASEKAKRIFLAIWGVSLFLPYVNEYFTPYTFGACSWNAFGTFYYFAGFNGYLILGHYLKNGIQLSTPKTLLLGIPLFIIGYLITFFGFRAITANPEATETQVELFWTFCSINVAMMTFATFIMIQKIRVTSVFLQTILSDLTKCGFGIYIIHYFFVGPCYSLTGIMGTPIYLQIPVAAILTFLSTWAVVRLIYCAPKAAKWIVG